MFLLHREPGEHRQYLLAAPRLPLRLLLLRGLLTAERQISEAYTKRTCLWIGGGFLLPEHKAVVPVLGSKMHNLPDSKGRANLRSATPAGFARAVFEAHYHAITDSISSA